MLRIVPTARIGLGKPWLHEVQRLVTLLQQLPLILALIWTSGQLAGQSLPQLGEQYQQYAPFMNSA